MTKLFAAAVLLVFLLSQTQIIAQTTTQGGVTGDPVADLQRKIDAGNVKLEFDGPQGYLRSLLKALNVPISSQSLVFSKSSFQMALISPKAPRAIYFNDDVYVGFVQNGSVLELVSIDAKTGPVFYTLDQDKDAPPKLQHLTTECLSCHIDSKNSVPRLFVLSVLPNAEGTAINAASLPTTDQSPLKERWGGWYVTGTHGQQRHMGNMLVRNPVPRETDIKDYIARLDLSAGANVTDLSSRFDTQPYLSPNSDIVALMLLTHQSEVHNLITLANSKVGPDSTAAVVKEVSEPLVKAMLFAWTPPFAEPIKGNTDFAADFSGQGPRDSQGRSLRDLDLNQRLLRYPLSYLIYSKAFDELAKPVKDYVYGRLRNILTGQDQSRDFAHLSPSDRRAILEILTDTKPDFAASIPQ